MKEAVTLSLPRAKQKNNNTVQKIGIAFKFKIVLVEKQIKTWL